MTLLVVVKFSLLRNRVASATNSNIDIHFFPVHTYLLALLLGSPAHFSTLQATESWVGPGNEAMYLLVS